MNTVHELLGAYALGAVEDNERQLVDELLTRDAEAAAEVARHAQVVELLGAMQHAFPPDDIWEKVAVKIEGPPQDHEVPNTPLDELGARRLRTRTGFGVRELVAAVVVVVVGVVALLQAQRITDLNETVAGQDTEIATLASAVANPLVAAAEQASAGAFERVQLVTDTSDVNLNIVLLEDGRGYVTNSSLSPLSEDRTYQLWAIMDDDRIISAAVLGQEPGVDTFVVELDGLVGFAVTEEVTGGVVASENPAVVVGLIDA